MPFSIKIGTRGSALALWQARETARKISAIFPDAGVRIEVVRTSGDSNQDSPLFKIGGKGLFTKELEEKLLDGSIDAAVHSLKDLPTELPPGLETGAILERGASSDALVVPAGGPAGLERLEPGACIGTSSLRRRSQLLAARPDVRAEDIRGNLDTRLGKLASGRYDGFIAAAAGLERLGVDRASFEIVELGDFVSAPGQGAIAVETAAGRTDLKPLLSALDHPLTRACVEAERAFLEKLGGGCHVPVGALARKRGNGLHLIGLVSSPDGTKSIRVEEFSEGSPAALGRDLAERALSRGAGEILDLTGL